MKHTLTSMLPRRLIVMLLALLPVGLADAADKPPGHEMPVLTSAVKALYDFRKPPREVREVTPGFLWIDAEDFADYGGWWIDTQFVAFMGSAYLIAAGVCDPVKDAVTSVDVPRPGRYRLWVRTKNWHPEHSPGRFKVAINGQAAAQVFGAGKTPAWVWESGGEFDLPAGPARLSLQDLTGAYGRCDALILTTDAAIHAARRDGRRGSGTGPSDRDFTGAAGRGRL